MKKMQSSEATIFVVVIRIIYTTFIERIKNAAYSSDSGEIGSVFYGDVN